MAKLSRMIDLFQSTRCSPSILRKADIRRRGSERSNAWFIGA
jgi:hypothetical protein